MVQRLFWIALVSAAAPLAFLRLTRHALLPFDGALSFNEADLFDDLYDGEVAAAG